MEMLEEYLDEDQTGLFVLRPDSLAWDEDWTMSFFVAGSYGSASEQHGCSCPLSPLPVLACVRNCRLTFPAKQHGRKSSRTSRKANSC